MKNFDLWNEDKKDIDAKTKTVPVRPGDVFWTHCGINVGIETNGGEKDSLVNMLQNKLPRIKRGGASNEA